MVEVVHNFTVEKLDWSPYLTPVDRSKATPAQEEALKETPSGLPVADFMLVLAHDPESLLVRTPLINAVLYGRGGLPRADRELGALAASVLNRCVYCAAVHAQRFIGLSKRSDVIEEIFREETDAKLDSRHQAVFDFGVKLSACPPEATEEDVKRLRAEGFSDAEILDLVHSVAIFGWANRVMHTLGEPFASP